MFYFMHGLVTPEYTRTTTTEHSRKGLEWNVISTIDHVVILYRGTNACWPLLAKQDCSLHSH